MEPFCPLKNVPAPSRTSNSQTVLCRVRGLGRGCLSAPERFFSKPARKLDENRRALASAQVWARCHRCWTSGLVECETALGMSDPAISKPSSLLPCLGTVWAHMVSLFGSTAAHSAAYFIRIIQYTYVTPGRCSGPLSEDVQGAGLRSRAPVPGRPTEHADLASLS